MHGLIVPAHAAVYTRRAGVHVGSRHTYTLPGGHVLPGDVCRHPRQKKHKNAKRRLHLLYCSPEQCPELSIRASYLYRPVWLSFMN